MNRVLVPAMMIVTALAVPSTGHADPIEDLQTQVAVLTLAVKQLQNRTLDLETQNGALIARVTSAEAVVASVGSKLARVTTSPDGRQIVIEGANLHVRSGAGATDAPVNGLGNLIIGYDEQVIAYPFYDRMGTGPEKDSGSLKTGSHNLVVGDGHSYTSFAGVVFGHLNRITAPFATATGGRGHIAGAVAASVAGGVNALARGEASTIAGGTHNVTRQPAAAVLGGRANIASGPDSAVCGGNSNTASGPASTVHGGASGQATAEASSVGGGLQNRATGVFASIAGGAFNSAAGDHAAIAGGSFNVIEATGAHATILGGIQNTASHPAATVTGGRGAVTQHNDDIAP
jgi:hypothetical protein